MRVYLSAVPMKGDYSLRDADGRNVAAVHVHPYPQMPGVRQLRRPRSRLQIPRSPADRDDTSNASCRHDAYVVGTSGGYLYAMRERTTEHYCGFLVLVHVLAVSDSSVDDTPIFASEYCFSEFCLLLF